MLEVKDLHKFYGTFHAVRGISFEVNQGEIVGLLGPNGAGKTTTMKIVTGFMLMTSGEVRVDGCDVATESIDVRSRLGYLPEHAPLYEDMTVSEYLTFMAEMRGLRGPEKKMRLEYVIDKCSLTPKRRAGIKTLSKGYRQRVGLAQAIIHEPRMVVLDEPTIGLDPNQIMEARQLIRGIGHGNTVIFSSHILSEVEATCSRVVIINEGRIVANGTPGELQAVHADDSRFDLTISGGDDDAFSRISGLGCVESLHVVQCDDGSRAFDVRCSNAPAFPGDVAGLASSEKWELRKIAVRRPSLEDVFKTLTRGAPPAEEPQAANAGGVLDDPEVAAAATTDETAPTEENS